MKSILTFIGNHDKDPYGNPGPIISLLAVRSADRLYLFYNNEHYLPVASEINKYCRQHYPDLEVLYIDCPALDPTDYNLVYPAMYSSVNGIPKESSDDEFTICITGGTPTMHACWIFLVEGGVIDAEIVQVARSGEVNPVSFILDDFPQIKKVKDVKSELTRLARENKKLKDTIDFQTNRFIGESPAILEIRSSIKRVAATDIIVLINGESGTGKEEVARSLHQLSDRSKKPMTVVNCGAIPRELFESELFGHKKGAFTGADKDKAGYLLAGNGGTIFLDEIGDLVPEHQVKLLRALEKQSFIPVGATKEIHIDVRFIFATNKDLQEMIAQGDFRKDLYYRMAQFQITCPPLRDRGKDKLLIAEAFLRESNIKVGLKKSFTHETKRKILDHQWPGNVRELRNSIDVAFALSDQDIKPDDLRLNESRHFNSKITIPDEGVDLENEILPLYYDAALVKAGNNATKASALLGFKPHTFRARLKKRNNDDPDK